MKWTVWSEANVCALRTYRVSSVTHMFSRCRCRRLRAISFLCIEIRLQSPGGGNASGARIEIGELIEDNNSNGRRKEKKTSKKCRKWLAAVAVWRLSRYAFMFCDTMCVFGEWACDARESVGCINLQNEANFSQFCWCSNATTVYRAHTLTHTATRQSIPIFRPFLHSSLF